MKKPLTPLQIKIAKRRKAMLSDPACVKALKKFDLVAFEAQENTVRQHFIGYLSYVNYKQALVVEKARKASLLLDTEARLKLRAGEALDDYESIAKSFARVTKALNTSGLGKSWNGIFHPYLKTSTTIRSFPKL